MTGSNFLEIVSKNSITIEYLLIAILYYLLFVIGYLILHTQIIRINREYAITNSFCEKYFEF